MEKIKKLIIWDFDGVISDTEKLWIETRRDLLNKYYNLNWTFDDTNKYLGGMSDATKKEVLKSLNISADDNFSAASLLSQFDSWLLTKVSY